MKTLSEIKNEVAKDLFDCTFLQYASFATITDINGFMNVVATRYATEALREAVEIVKAHAEYDRIDVDGTEANIINLINELK